MNGRLYKNQLRMVDHYVEIRAMQNSPLLSATEQQAATEFAKKLENIFGNRLLLVKLFGSCARGERSEESDIDILVLIDGLSWEEKRRVWDEATLISIAQDTLLSPLVMRPEEFQKLKDRERRVALDIEKEGIKL